MHCQNSGEAPTWKSNEVYTFWTEWTEKEISQAIWSWTVFSICSYIPQSLECTDKHCYDGEKEFFWLPETRVTELAFWVNYSHKRRIIGAAPIRGRCLSMFLPWSAALIRGAAFNRINCGKACSQYVPRCCHVLLLQWPESHTSSRSAG